MLGLVHVVHGALGVLDGVCCNGLWFWFRREDHVVGDACLVQQLDQAGDGPDPALELVAGEHHGLACGVGQAEDFDLLAVAQLDALGCRLVGWGHEHDVPTLLRVAAFGQQVHLTGQLQQLGDADVSGCRGRLGVEVEDHEGVVLAVDWGDVGVLL